MGAVYRARHVPTGAEHALKVILPQAAGGVDDEDLARFRREAELLARGGSHPALVTIHSVGEDHLGTLFCAMELVEGESLAYRIAAGGPMPVAAAAAIVAGAARGLDHLHARGVVHRDIKAANIMIDEQGLPRVLDFGLAFDPRATRLTATGDILGTPASMAPEQVDPRIAGGTIGPAADVYALGALLYHLVTGQPPFTSRDPLLTLQQVLGEEPTPPSSIVPRIPRDLEAICAQAMEKAPERRYPSAAALADDLERWRRGERVRARRRGVVPPAARRMLAGRWRTLAVAGITSCALVVALAIILSTGGSATSPSVPATTDRPLAGVSGSAARADPDGSERIDLETDGLVSRRIRIRSIWGDATGRHANAVYSVQFLSPESVAFGDGDGMVVVRHVRTGRESAAVEVGGLARDLSLARDGTLVVAIQHPGAESQLAVVDVERARVRHRVTGLPDMIRGAEVTPDPTRALAGGVSWLGVWDLETGDQVWRATGEHVGDARAVAVLDDGRGGIGLTTQSEAPATLAFWDLATGRWLGGVEIGDGWPFGLAVSPERGLAIASAWTGRVVVVDPETRSCLRTLDVAPFPASLAFVPGSDDVASGHGLGAVSVWDGATGAVRIERVFHRETVFALDVSPDGRLVVSGGYDGQTRCWEIATGEELWEAAPGHSEWVTAVAYSADGARIHATSRDGAMLSWDIATGEPTTLVAPKREAGASNDGSILAAAFSADRRRAITSLDAKVGIITIRDLAEDSREIRIPKVPDPRRPGKAMEVRTTRLALTADGRRALAAGEDGRVRLLDVDSGTIEHTLEGARGHGDASVFALAIAAGGELALSGDERGRVKLWRVEGGVDFFELEGHEDAVFSTVFVPSHPDQPLALTGDRRGVVRIFELIFGEEKGRLLGHDDVVDAIVVTADGRTVITASRDRTVRIWDLEERRELDRIDLGDTHDFGRVLALSPDERELTVGTARGLILRFEIDLEAR